MDPLELAPGDVIDGRYAVEEPIGRGGYGTVWRVRHLGLDATRAMKVLHDPGAQLAARLREEGQVLARLEHPNIVRVHDLVDVGESLALVMELVEGPSLAEYLAEGAPSLELVQSIGQGILAGLEEAHRQGVLHRDLKPANILLTDGLVPKLVDFGLAAESSGGRMEAAGTPTYMAPEQLEGRCDERSDLFSAACVLYELATGRRAFEATALAQMMMAKVDGRFDPPRSLRPDLPAGMAKALGEALAPQPRARPLSAAVLAKRWRLPARSQPSLGSSVPDALPSDLGSVGDSRATDRALCRRLPAPLANAWQRVGRAPSDEARGTALAAAAQITLKFTVALLLADYLSGAPQPEVETWLGTLEAYDGERWLEGLQHLAGAVAAREEPFIADAKELVAGTALVTALRDVVRGDASAAEVRAVLVSMLFLDRTRLFRPLVDRGGGTGKVQFLMGSDGAGEPAPSNWSAKLLDREVYAIAASGHRVLAVSPWVRFVADAGGEERVQVFGGVQGDALWLVDPLGRGERVEPIGVEGLPVSLAEFLGQRGRQHGVQANHDDLGALSPPGSSSASGFVVGGRFELSEVLGVGGMSTVHRAFDRLADEEVALKLLAVDFASDPEFRERFKREAQRMRQLDHPHVLSSVELGSLDSGQLWLRMPVLDGGTLRERIAAGPLTTEQVTTWTEQLLSALTALADAGVVHRDIKPSNLLLGPKDSLMLVDFGVALSEDDARLTRTLQQLGSLAYLAPECRGSGDATHVSDVYSAALVIHEMVTGKPARALPGKGIEGSLGRWLRLMGAIDPDDRPTAAEVLEGLSEEEGSHEEPVLVPERLPGADDRRLLAVGVPLGALCGVGLGTPAWTVLPLAYAPDFVARGMVAAALGGSALVWVFAAGGALLPLVAGLGFGHARRHGAVAGAVAAAVGFAVGGVQVGVALGSRPVFAALQAGTIDVPPVLGDALVRLAWLLLAGAVVAPVWGALLGAAGATLASKTRSSDLVVAAPDPYLRQVAGAGLIVLSAASGVAYPALELVLDTVRQGATSAVGLDVSLGGVWVLASVPWVLGQALGLWLAASPTLPPHRGETLLRGSLLVVVVAVQALVAGWLPALVSGAVLAGVLVWRRPWQRAAEPGPPRDVMAIASAALAAIAVGALGLPLLHLGLAAQSSLLWSLDALNGLTDPVPAATLVDAQLRHHFASTRLVLAGSALAAMLVFTLGAAVTTAVDAVRGALPNPRDSLLAVALGGGVSFVMVFGTGHDLFEASTADPRPAVPELSRELQAGDVQAWRLWAQGDLLHAVIDAEPEDGEVRRLIVATSALVQGRAPALTGDLTPAGQALALALDGDPGPLHAHLDDPLLASLHRALASVPWLDDPHDDLGEPSLPVDHWVDARRAGAPLGGEGARFELERAWHAQQQGVSPAAFLVAARQAAPNRVDGRMQALQTAVLEADVEVETRLREQLFSLGSAVAHAPAHTMGVADAYLATGRLRSTQEFLRGEVRRAVSRDEDVVAAQLVGAAKELAARPGVGARGFAADLETMVPAGPWADAPCVPTFRGDAAAGLRRIALGQCPATSTTRAWEGLLHAQLLGDGEEHEAWLRAHWPRPDPMPASQGLSGG